MSWKGFLKESKLYMSYPQLHKGKWTERNHASVLNGGWTYLDMRKEKLKFWLQFPRAFIKFYWYTIKDFIKYKIWYRIQNEKNW